MELEPRLIYSLIIGAPLFIIFGMGVTIAAVVYLLDRQIRRAQAEAEIAEARYAERQQALRDQPAGAAAGPGTLVLSPISRMVTAEGVVEAGPTMGLPSNKLGMWIFLASEIMFFTALIGVFVNFKARGLLTTTGVLNVPLAALNTFILIVSSFTLVMALDSIQRSERRRFTLFLLATLVLGATFIALQGVEWSLLLGEGVTPSEDLFGTAFFVLTGFHGAHVIIGLLWLFLTLLRAARGDFSSQNNMGIELFGLYWHFVDIIWIVLFTIIYLI